MILPSNNITNPSNPQAVGLPPSFTPKNNNVSSSALAEVSFTPGVNVSLQKDINLSASTIPPIYSKPTIYASNEQQLSPSRANITGEAQAENALVQPSTAAQQTENTSDLSTETGSRQSEDGQQPPENRESSSRESSNPNELTPQEIELVEELKARDAEVKAHEQAHKAVGGQYTGAISYSYQSGPDGKRYAVGGEVPIDVAPIPGDPQATITKMTIVSAAATAPAEPSPQDLAVAAQATRQKSEAQAELSTMRFEEMTSKKESDSGDEDADSNNVEAEVNNDPFVSNALSQIQTISKLESQDETVLDVMV